MFAMFNHSALVTLHIRYLTHIFHSTSLPAEVMLSLWGCMQNPEERKVDLLFVIPKHFLKTGFMGY